MMTPTPNSGEQGEFGDDLSLHVDRVREGTHGEIHSAKAHRCVDHVQGKGHDESSAWAICTASIGKRGVYSKGHGGSASPKRKVHEGDAPPEGCGLCEACKKNKKRMYERVMEAAVQEVNRCHGKGKGHPCDYGVETSKVIDGQGVGKTVATRARSKKHAMRRVAKAGYTVDWAWKAPGGRFPKGRGPLTRV